MSRSLTPLALALVCVLAIAVAPGAQDPPATPQQSSQTFRLEARFVRVDVYPTRNGAPVLDLKQEDFEVLEDNVPQTIATFEHVLIKAAPAGTERIEPNSQQAGNQMAGDPRNRVFVVFLDTYHVTKAGSRRVGPPLARMLDKLLAPEDLVGLMKPQMDVTDLILGRKIAIIQGGLMTNLEWGQRLDQGIGELEPIEDVYAMCFPSRGTGFLSPTARAMIERRRERIALDALQDTVRHLYALRDERKAILVVSDGWQLFRPSNTLSSMGSPTVPGIYVGPGGRLGTTNPQSITGGRGQCERDLQMLANLDNYQHFLEIVQEANRYNASFYPVDPRGIAVFDSDRFMEITDPTLDAAMLADRQSSLRNLASATDGLAVMNSNNISAGLQRIVDDTSSYYLLGYYSTNDKLDGKYRRIKVRVKRPGVDVRAREGYRAVTLKELTEAVRPAPVAPAESAERAQIAEALGRLTRVRPGALVHLQAVGLTGPPAIVVVGEIIDNARTLDLTQGADVAIIVAAPDSSNAGSAQLKLPPGSKTFQMTVPLPENAKPGEYEVLLRLADISRSATDATKASVGAGAIADPLVYRIAGARQDPAPAARFRRIERVRVEAVVTADAKNVTARLLDAAGNPLPIPLSVSERQQDSRRLAVIDVNIAPLTFGEYVVELTAEGAPRVLRALSIVR